MKIFDSFLIEGLFEPFSHFVQKWTGFNNFAVARLIIFLSILSLYASGWFGFDGWLFFGMFTIYLLWLLFKHVSTIEKRVYDDLQKGCKNYLIEKRLADRIYGVIINFIYILIMMKCPLWLKCLLGCSVANLIAAYFYSCTPLPPGKSKIREFLERTVEVLIHQPDALPSPG